MRKVPIFIAVLVIVAAVVVFTMCNTGPRFTPLQPTPIVTPTPTPRPIT